MGQARRVHCALGIRREDFQYQPIEIELTANDCSVCLAEDIIHIDCDPTLANAALPNRSGHPICSDDLCFLVGCGGHFAIVDVC